MFGFIMSKTNKQFCNKLLNKRVFQRIMLAVQCKKILTNQNAQNVLSNTCGIRDLSNSKNINENGIINILEIRGK